MKCDAFVFFKGAPGGGFMLREQMIGKWYVEETGKEVRFGDNVEVAYVMTRSRV